MLTVIPLHRNGGPIPCVIPTGPPLQREHSAISAQVETVHLVCPYSVDAGRSVAVAWLRDELVGYVALMLVETEATAFGERCRRYAIAARVGDDTYAASIVRPWYLAPPGEVMKAIGRPLARALAEAIVDAWIEQEGDR